MSTVTASQSPWLPSALPASTSLDHVGEAVQTVGREVLELQQDRVAARI